MDVDRFPAQHHKNLKVLLYDMAETQRRHSNSYYNLLRLHNIAHVSSYEINEQTFRVVEQYHAMIDAVNSYSSYLVTNNLQKYIKNG
jgi:hypothetical protein